MGTERVDVDDGDPTAFETFRRFFALERDVLVLSLAMFAFSLGFQMTSRFLPEYMVALGASGFVVGLFGTFGNVVSAAYPYPGGAVSDRIGSRYALTLFGLLSTLGFAVTAVFPVGSNRTSEPARQSAAGTSRREPTVSVYGAGGVAAGVPEPKTEFDQLHPCDFYTPAELLDGDLMYTVPEIGRLLQDLEPDADLDVETENVLLDWTVPWIMFHSEDLVVAEPTSEEGPGYYGLKE